MEGGGVAPSAHGEYVEYSDHMASHSCDEAREMELCMIAYEDIPDHTKAFFKEFKQGWLACAKSRARSAE